MTSIAPDPRIGTRTPRELVAGFIDAVAGGDLERAFETVSPDASVTLHPLGAAGGAEVARKFWTEAVGAFPDLLLRCRRTCAYSDGRVLVELIFEGTQSADFAGAINQEKHLDIEQAWLFATGDGLITSISGYWDQNKLYRRLAVKRLDQISIAGREKR